MTYAGAVALDEFDSDPWLTDLLQAPASLRPLLRIYSATRRFAIIEAIAEELGLDIEYAATPTLHVMDGLVEPMAHAVRDRQVGLERALTIAESAIRRRPLNELVVVLRDLGWGRTEVGPVAVLDLEEAVRGRLARKLSQPVHRTLRRWVRLQPRRDGAKKARLPE